MKRTRYLLLFLLTFLQVLSESDLIQNNEIKPAQKLWSILIPTLESRARFFNRIYTLLSNQIKRAGLEDQIEILYFLDNRQHSIGYKRNHLLQQSSAKYTCFVDDDDLVSDDYITLIYNKLLLNPDCVSLTGEITTNGGSPRKFIHSLKYNSYFEQNNIYYRPPNHLNPIRRSIAAQFRFPDKNKAEDSDWTMEVVKSGLLKTEQVIDKTYYYYIYIEHK